MAIVVSIISLPAIYFAIVWQRSMRQQRRDVTQLVERARTLTRASSLRQLTAHDLAIAVQLVSEIADLPYMQVREIPELRNLWQSRRDIRNLARKAQQSPARLPERHTRLEHSAAAMRLADRVAATIADPDRIDYVRRDAMAIAAQASAAGELGGSTAELFQDRLRLWVGKLREPIREYALADQDRVVHEASGAGAPLRRPRGYASAKREEDREQLVARQVEKAVLPSEA